jgi:hypothetical protein
VHKKKLPRSTANPSLSVIHHPVTPYFEPECGENSFFQNVGIYLNIDSYVTVFLINMAINRL